jgi:hypothetical protein
MDKDKNFMVDSKSQKKFHKLLNEKYTKFKENKLEKISDLSRSESDYSGGNAEITSKEKKTNQDDEQTNQDDEEQNLSPQPKGIEVESENKKGSSLRRIINPYLLNVESNSAHMRSQRETFDEIPNMEIRRTEAITTLSDSNNITDSVYRERLQKELQLEKMKAIEILKRKFYYLHNELCNNSISDKLYKSVRKYTVFAKQPRKNELFEEAMIDSDDELDALHNSSHNMLELDFDPIIQTPEMEQKRLKLIIKRINVRSNKMIM